MTIEYKDSKRIVKLSSDVVETPTYTANYDDTNTWTKTGTKTTVNETVSGKVNWNFSSNYTSAENHLETTPLGFTLDNEKWVCDFEFNASAFDNSAETFLVVFQENAGDFISTSGDGLTCAIYSNKTIRLWKKDGSTHSIDSNANAITIATGTDYYARFSRTSATVIKFELFTDSARTAHVSGSPITFTFSETIQGLDNLTHCGRSDNVGATKTYNVSLDNLKIWNGVASVSSKPTDIQDNSILVEKDTARRYWSSGYLPANTATHTDDFSSDGWTDSDSTYIGVSGGSMNWNCKRDGTNDASVYDLSSTSANWVLRFKLKVTNVSASTQAGNGFYVGLSDSNQTAGQSTSQDFIGVSIYNDNTDTYRTIDADGSALPAIYQGDSSQSTTYNTNSIWYYEIIKTGSSYTVEAFSGSDYSTGSEGKITGSSDATGLRYLKVLNDMANIPTSTNPFQGTIDDLKFYNNVTNADLVPATWTRELYFTPDFSYANQTSANLEWVPASNVAGRRVNISNDTLELENDNSTTNCCVAYDFGSGQISDTKWVLRFSAGCTTVDGSKNWCYIGLSNADQTVSGSTAQDGVYVGFQHVGANKKFWGIGMKQSVPNSASTYSFTAAPNGTLTNSTFYIQVRRLSATSIDIKVYSDSSYSTLVWDSGSQGLDTNLDLRYLKFINNNDSGAGGSIDIVMKNVKFRNGAGTI